MSKEVSGYQKHVVDRNFLLLQICLFYDDVVHISYGDFVACTHCVCQFDTLAQLKHVPFNHWFLQNQIYVQCPLSLLFSFCCPPSFQLSKFFFSCLLSLEIRLAMFYILLQMASSLCFS